MVSASLTSALPLCQHPHSLRFNRIDEICRTTVVSLHQRACNLLTFSAIKLQKHIVPLNSAAGVLFLKSKGFLAGGLLYGDHKRFLTPKIMSEWMKNSAFRNDSNEDERFQKFEQEAFVDGSTELRPELISCGLEAFLNRLSKWLVATLFGAVLLSRHDAEALWAAMGAIINAMLSVALKRVLNQERPITTLRSDPGMPSSHAVSLSYTAVFAVLSIVEWLGINELSLSIGGLTLACASYLTWLRVSQKLHTISQVVVGATVGSIFCILWHMTWKAVVVEAFASTLWVQIFVAFGAVGLCLGFLVYVVRNWFREEP